MRGPVWPVDDRELPLSSLAAPSLCLHHNQALGSDDALVGQFAKNLRELNAPDAHEVVAVSGWALERWCLKALIGILANGCHLSSEGHRITLDAAPEDLASAAYGRSRLCGGRGLNVIQFSATVGVQIEAISWKVLVANAEATRIVGFLVALPPIVLALTLEPGDVAALLRQVTLPHIDDWSNVLAYLRPPRLELRGRESRAHLDIRFDWSN